MTPNIGQASMVTAASFEERSPVTASKFVASGGRAEAVFLADVKEAAPEYARQLSKFRQLGVINVDEIDRFSSVSLWAWCLSVLQRAAKLGPSLIIDITCMPRELLGMLLFAVRVHQGVFRRVFVAYVAAPPNGYATQNLELAKADRWLSKGVMAIRTIVGYPGTFHGERPTHLIALAGHELERLNAIVEYVEPSRLTIGSEEAMTSTAFGAGDLSQEVAKDIRDRIQVPDTRNISFSASSIEDVVESLWGLNADVSAENVALVAMNTKLVFVGAALYSLMNADIRMIYAVPREYNPLYCAGIGTEYFTEITEMLKLKSD